LETFSLFDTLGIFISRQTPPCEAGLVVEAEAAVEASIAPCETIPKRHPPSINPEKTFRYASFVGGLVFL
jgi:hypothetical protein